VHGVPAIRLLVGFPGELAAVAQKWRRELYQTPSDDLKQPVNLETAAKFEEFALQLLLKVTLRRKPHGRKCSYPLMLPADSRVHRPKLAGRCKTAQRELALEEANAEYPLSDPRDLRSRRTAAIRPSVTNRFLRRGIKIGNSPGRKKAAALASGDGNPKVLLPNLVYAIAGLGLRGLDLETVLLGGRGEETRIECFCLCCPWRLSGP
jgi:hypothetical protein